MKKIFTLAFTLFLPLVAMAQTLKTPTLDDLMWGGSNYWNLVPRNTATAWWGDALVRTDVEGVSLLRNAKGAAVKAQAPLFTLDEVNAAIDTVRYGRVRSLYSVTFPEAAKPLAQITTPKAMFLYDWQAKRVVWTLPLPKDIGHEDFNPTSRSLAYTEAYNLYVLTADGRRHAVSTDGNRELLYGTSVHRDEFGIHKGTFWSPDGSRLAFYRMDQTMVTDYPLVDIQVPEAERVARPAPEKYPMAGMTSHKVTVGIFDPAMPATPPTAILPTSLGVPTDSAFICLKCPARRIVPTSWNMMPTPERASAPSTPSAMTAMSSLSTPSLSSLGMPRNSSCSRAATASTTSTCSMPKAKSCVSSPKERLRCWKYSVSTPKPTASFSKAMLRDISARISMPSMSKAAEPPSSTTAWGCTAAVFRPAAPSSATLGRSPTPTV